MKKINGSIGVNLIPPFMQIIEWDSSNPDSQPTEIDCTNGLNAAYIDTWKAAE